MRWLVRCRRPDLLPEGLRYCEDAKLGPLRSPDMTVEQMA